MNKKIGIIGFGQRASGVLENELKFFPELKIAAIADVDLDKVKEIGKLLGLPKELVEKTPIDGLCGKSDEENLGFTYAVLDRYIRTGEIDDLEIKEKIDKRHKANLFKLEIMPIFDPEI